MSEATTNKPKRRYAREPKNSPDTMPSASTGPATTRSGQTKIDKVIALLKSKDGATLDDLTRATGWLPHTARAAMTGLRKKGHTIERTTVDGVSRYAIVSGA